ncbi:hypothetical protein C463_02171 [Halorubrum californiense DSM 19288]|uniref:Uncharacterized protein n=1 Tax=Halorubrum californiense DSM 19288 TaxID=1227465 RepID=M0EMZ5_9EURY|nr:MULTISPECIES: hypothetical protein [Halorubrum]ELZ47784.1 hypothetical protein C463_02171 [Halorubrum californiense DSM 19288]TKX71203.1 hypothetical protein EXE40_08190 [Halorubrum sp. GN11GM_10-3_MGM]
MVVGLGALATGSGAVFSSAAFSNSATSSADFRVVVEDNLILEAGGSFRNDNDAYLDNPSDSKFYGGNSNSLFSGESGLDGVEPDDLPAAWANDKTNSNLEVETAVQNLGTFEFSDFLQVTNEGTETAQVGIRFEEYGADVNGGPIAASDLIQAYEFYNKGGDGGKISTDGNPTGSVSNQSLSATTAVPAGATEQIGLKIDLTVGSISSNIADAAKPGTDDVFNGGGEYDTVHLVEKLRVGSDSTADDQ